MCEHLTSLESELKNRGIKETYRGQVWTSNCREWVYFDCVLNLEKLRQRFNFQDFIKDHINDDLKSGLEKGFYCALCKDGIIGVHPNVSSGIVMIE